MEYVVASISASESPHNIVAIVLPVVVVRTTIIGTHVRIEAKCVKAQDTTWNFLNSNGGCRFVSLGGLELGFLEVAACSSVVTEIDTLEATSTCCTMLVLCFFFRNSALLRAFLLFVKGLTFFLVRASGEREEALLSLVSKEKERVELESILREKVKALPWLTNVWQRARH